MSPSMGLGDKLASWTQTHPNPCKTTQGGATMGQGAPNWDKTPAAQPLCCFRAMVLRLADLAGA